MQLQPSHPPCRKRRKVRAFARDIHRLHDEGYTCEEIRLALVDIGVVVSRSTVQREAARALTPDASPARVAAPPSAPALSVGAQPAPQTLRLSSEARACRKAAEEFMAAQNTNPLMHLERTLP